jgi:hypothetical protein
MPGWTIAVGRIAPPRSREMGDLFRNGFKAAALASLAGGPLSFALTGIEQLLSGDPVVIDDSILKAAPMIFVLAIFGWFFAIIPNLIGAMTLGWLGRFNIGFRQPGMWAIIGAAAGGSPMAAIQTYELDPIALMAAVGAVSALLCHTFVRWEEATID